MPDKDISHVGRHRHITYRHNVLILLFLRRTYDSRFYHNNIWLDNERICICITRLWMFVNNSKNFNLLYSSVNICYTDEENPTGDPTTTLSQYTDKNNTTKETSVTKPVWTYQTPSTSASQTTKDISNKDKLSSTSVPALTPYTPGRYACSLRCFKYISTL